jgi:hypothetical protein
MPMGQQAVFGAAVRYYSNLVYVGSCKGNLSYSSYGFGLEKHAEYALWFSGYNHSLDS